MASGVKSLQSHYNCFVIFVFYYNYEHKTNPSKRAGSITST
jgi:hypothetical protein